LREGSSLIRKTVIVLVIVAAGLIIWSFARKSEAPQVRFLKVTRQTLTSTLETNGKVEPVVWASARASVAGTVEKVFVERGQTVTKGTPLVALDTRQATADLAAANAKIAQGVAEQQTVLAGGRPGELADIDSKLSRARLDLETAQRDYDSLKRLVARQAATRKEAADAAETLKQDQIQIEALQQRRATLIAPADRASAQARIQEARAAADLARANLALGLIRSPIDGTIYQFDMHAGTYLNPGDLVANIGKLDQVRVIVYVDDVDLGRVAKDMPVLITWDSLPGRQWRGRVDKPATQVVSLGTRQVGEVSSIVDNPDHDLLPGTNINAEVESGVVQNALTISKEAVRRHNEQTGVLLLQGDHIVWRPVELGVSTLLRAQVKTGVEEGDAVAGPSDLNLTGGMKVKPVFR
jgi:HlyD family secretion protein